MKRIFKLSLTALVIAIAAAIFSVFTLAADSTVLEAKNGSDGIELTWSENENVYYYKIYRKASDESNAKLLSSTQTTSLVDTDVLPGIGYHYQVVPFFDDSTEGSRSNTATVLRMTTPKLGKVFSQKEGIHLEWSASRGAESYLIYRREEGQSKWTLVGKTASAVTSFLDTSPITSGNCIYAVRGAAGKFFSENSNFVSATYVGPPKIISLACVKEGIEIKWSTVPSSKYYMVYRATNREPEYKMISLLDANYTSYIDKGVTPGSTVGYILRAVDERDELSSYDKATLINYMSKPVFTSASSAEDGIKLTWSKSMGSQGYAIFRRSPGSAEWIRVKLVNGENTLSAIDTTAVNGKSYTYVVRGVWKGNLSNYDENGISIRYIKAPAEVKVKSYGEKGNLLTWSKSPLARAYCVYRKPIGGKWKIVAKTTENVLKDRSAGSENFSYAVVSYISSNCYSAPSKIVTAGGVDPSRPMVAVTYDDGPGGSSTNRILDLLEEYDAKATFFVIGENIDYNHETLQRAAKMGCEIGNHTFDHVNLTLCSASEIQSQVNSTDALVKKYTGSATSVMRAPGGATDEASRKAAGKPFFYWSVDTRDWESKDPSSIIDIATNQAYDGAIILMHDIYDTTADASETIIPWLVNQGYQLVTVSELMQYKGANVKAGESYSDGYDY